MTQAEMIRSAIALGALYGVYRFAPHPAIKAMALGTAGVIVARKVPYVKDALA